MMDTQNMMSLDKIKMEVLSPETEAELDDYICQECHRAFQYPSQLLLHITSSHQTDNTSSGNKKSLTQKKKYAKDKTSEKSRYCKKCDKLFSSSGHFQRHLKAFNHDGVDFNCEVCQKSFHRPQELKVHQRVHKEERRFVCSVCSTAFRWLNNLKEHKQIHSGLRRHKCDKCDKSFTHFSTLRRHRVTHEAEKPHKCNQCWKSFIRLNRLNKHMLLHSGGQKPHKCTMCDKTFLYAYDMRRHQQQHHASDTQFLRDSQQRDQETEEQLTECRIKIESPDVTSAAIDWGTETAGMIEAAFDELCDYVCLECREPFQHRVQLAHHYTTAHHFELFNAVTNTPPKTSNSLSSSHKDGINKEIIDGVFPGKPLFACSLCDKTFSQRCHLTRHQAVHSVEKNYECPVCLKRFRWHSTFKDHKLNHAIDRNFECKVCKKRFKRAECLKAHQRTHSDYKQYLCHVCDKSYKYPTSLQMHLRTHTSEKTFQCEKCARSFYHSRNLKNHMFTHTDVKPYQCQECDKSFGLISRLQNHMLSHVRGQRKRGRKRKDRTSRVM